MTSIDRVTLRLGLMAVVAFATLLSLAAVAQAHSPAPALQVAHEAYPSRLAPGGNGGVVVTVANVGRTPTTDIINASVELPPGVTATAAGDGGGTWDCPTAAGAATVICTSNAGAPLVPKGLPSILYVSVTVDPSASGSGDFTTSVSGGGSLVAASSSASYAISDTPAAFGVRDFAGWALAADGSIASQAGGHPELTNDILLSSLERLGHDTASPVENARTIEVDLPPGLVANPTTVSTCSMVGITGKDYANCPSDSQVGTVELTTPQGGTWATRGFEIGLFNVEAPHGLPARLAFNFNGVVTYIDPVVSAENGYAISARVTNASQSLALLGSRTRIWGVPQDSIYDSGRFNEDGFPSNPSSSPRRPFVTAPTSCTGEALETRLSVVSWQQPGVMHSTSFDTDFNGDPILNEGCDRIAFAPSVETGLSSSAADAPAGLDVSIENPQNLESPDGLANAHLRDVVVELPDGLTVNPSSATGLEACSDEQLGLGNDEPIACPLGSKIGTAAAETPVLEERIEGGVYLRSQASDDPESGDMFRLALVMDNAERGIRVKLPGSVKADAETGRITASFKDNPQLPVESVVVSLKEGPRAPLATPAGCGEKEIGVGLSSWAGHDRDLSSGFAVDCPGLGGLAPSFAAGAVNPVGGDASPFVVRIGRQDREQFVDGVEVELPEGVLAKLAGVALCSDADANAGSCGAGSRVGSATVGAGPGSNPFYLKDQPVYLAGPYKGAPYSLSVAARAVAGPFDLGMVVVRQALHVDPETAQVKVVSDSVPTIVKGVPLRLRSIDVSVDRPDFARNPTSCSVKQVTARLHSQQGSSHTAASRFQVGDCQSLGFRPKLAMRLTGRRQTRTGGHPSLRAVVSQGRGQANIGKAEVTLPRSVVLDAVNSYDPKLVCDYDASLRADCPESTVIGTASAKTPLLDKPLTGKVHLVQGIKFGPKGNRIRTTPSLLVKLRGQVNINLRARTTVRDDRLVTTFPKVPDAQVSQFAMNIKGGSKGILVVTRTRRSKIDICRSKQTATVALDGHNGRNADFATTVKTPCAKAKKAKKAKRKRR